MKYKKQIVMICLVTFLFLPMSVKYEEPKAEVLLLTTGAIIACAALATAAGVIITNPDMLQDVGERIYDGIKDIPNAIENVGDNIKVNVTKSLWDSVFNICSSLPVEDYIKDFIEDYADSGVSRFSLSGYNGWNINVDATNANYSIYYVNIRENLIDSTSKILISTDGLRQFNLSCSYEEIGNDIYKNIYVDGSLVSSKSIYTFSGSKPSNEVLSRFGSYVTFGNTYNSIVKPVNGEVYENKSICIPYTPLNTESVSVDKPKEYFPVGSGSISVPMDTPLSNYNPSVDNPISLPTDLVGDGISADVDTSTDTGAIDKPNVDVGETPTTGDTLWDTLLSWLSSLFAPLVALLEWIGSILTSILDFLGSLVSSLVDAIVSLFAPTVAVDELFSIPEGSGFSDILSLFDWGLFDIEPKPYEFVATLDFMSLVDNTSNPQVIEIKLFDNELVKKYLPYVRNILSYSLLISTISMIVWHFIPKRDID